MCRVATVPARADFQADVALAIGPETKGVGGGMTIAVLIATFPYIPSLSSLGPAYVPAQADVALASGPEPKGVEEA